MNLSVCPPCGPGHDRLVGERMNLIVCPVSMVKNATTKPVETEEEGRSPDRQCLKKPTRIVVWKHLVLTIARFVRR